MKTAVVNFKTDPNIKVKAQKKASKLGVSLSDVLNNSLRKFVAQKEYGETPYGIFSGLKITEKEIDEITHSWNKTIDEIG